MNMSIGGASSAVFMRPQVAEASPATPVRAEDAAYRVDVAGTNGPQGAGGANGPPPGVGGPPPAGAKGPPPTGAGGPPPQGADKSDLSSLFATEADEENARDTVLASEETIVQALLENARLAVESNADADAADEDADVADASADRADEAERQMSEGRRAAQAFESQLSVMRAAFVGEDVAVTDLRV
jgi:hypothetical protein